MQTPIRPGAATVLGCWVADPGSDCEVLLGRRPSSGADMLSAPAEPPTCAVLDAAFVATGVASALDGAAQRNPRAPRPHTASHFMPLNMGAVCRNRRTRDSATFPRSRRSGWRHRPQPTMMTICGVARTFADPIQFRRSRSPFHESST